MNMLTNFPNNELIAQKNNYYLYFLLGENRYAINTEQISEIIKLPYLEYPQKLPNNYIGLLNYNNLTINVLDLRFYLKISPTPYDLSNQLLIINTDESIFAIIVDKVEDVISFESNVSESFTFQDNDKIIESIYKYNDINVSIINTFMIEELLKKGGETQEIDIQSLFPADENSKNILIKRKQAIAEKYKQNFVQNMFSDEKYISFSLNNNLYCLKLEFIKEFLKDVSITPVPCAPEYILGIIILRGDFITVIDAKSFSSLNQTYTKNIKNNVIIIQSEDFLIGFAVDEISEMIDIPKDLTEQNLHNQKSKYILCETVIDNKLYSVLNINNILSDEKLYIEERF